MRGSCITSAAGQSKSPYFYKRALYHLRVVSRRDAEFVLSRAPGFAARRRVTCRHGVPVHLLLLQLLSNLEHWLGLMIESVPRRTCTAVADTCTEWQKPSRTSLGESPCPVRRGEPWKASDACMGRAVSRRGVAIPEPSHFQCRRCLVSPCSISRWLGGSSHCGGHGVEQCLFHRV